MKLTYEHTKRAANLGYITQAIIVNLPPILFIFFQDQYNLSYEMLGRLVLLNFATQMVVDVLAVRYVDRIGYRRSAQLAHFATVVGLLCLALLPQVLPNPYIGLTISIMICAVGGGLIEVLITPIVDALPSSQKSGDIALLHSFYCWGHMAVVILSTVLILFIDARLWWMLPLAWSIIPLYNFFNFGKVPLIEPHDQPAAFSLRTLLRSRWFFLAMLLMIASGAAEQIIAQWSSLFAEQALGVSKFWGDLTGPTAFALCMGLARMYYGLNEQRLKLARVICLSGGILLVGYLITVFSPWSFGSLIGTALCGLGVGVMWPGCTALAAQRFPGGGTPLFGTLAIMGDIGCALGPWIAGIVSGAVVQSPQARMFAAARSLGIEELGLKAGILMGISFSVILILGGWIFIKRPAIRTDVSE